ncbi:LysM peptidoglycan-binding domain-containing M23 family metallopeptidase [soil metagenome]
MRNRVPALRSRALGQAAFIVVIAGVAAGCSNSSRLSEPFFTGSTENQKEIIGKDVAQGQPMPAAIPPGSASVSRNELPPPPQTAYAPAQPMSAQPAPQQVAMNGQGGWSALGGQVVTLKPGENLDTLTQKYGVPPEQILQANQFKSPADIRAGRVVVIPHRVATTPETAAAAAAYRPVSAGAPMALAAPAATPIAPAASKVGATSHTVAAGETLYAVSRKYGVRVMDIAAVNGIRPDAALSTGQVLKIPAGGMTKVVAAVPATPVAAPVKPIQVASADPKMKIPAASVSTQPAPGSIPPIASTLNAPSVPAVPQVPVVAKPQDAASAAAAVDQAADTPSANGTSFRWPVRGRIIASFGSKPNGEKNDGINLAVPEGTTVKAAEAGVVIYAGNELEGYGNLILIRHADGWVSAYAHNKDIMVKRGDKIARGQVVAHAGASGSVTSPQVHFELRKGAKPVNPLDYLAG